MKRSPWCCFSLVLMVGIVAGGFFVKDMHNLSQVGWHYIHDLVEFDIRIILRFFCVVCLGIILHDVLRKKGTEGA
jgi:hypothetical protein